MHCPNCKNSATRVVDSRTISDGKVVRRRRVCAECDYRFTTYERHERNIPAVVKKDGRREPFQRGKVLAGLKKACEKRPISTQELEKAVDTLEDEISSKYDKEVTSSIIGEWVMDYLKKIDDVAYVRFASVYRSFKDIDQFFEELSTIMQKRRTARRKRRKRDNWKKK